MSTLNWVEDETKNSNLDIKLFTWLTRYPTSKPSRFHCTLQILKPKDNKHICQLRVYRANHEKKYKFEAISREQAKAQAEALLEEHYSNDKMIEHS